MGNEKDYEYINEGVANGFRFILTQAGFREIEHFWFSNGLIFMHENYQEAMLDAIGEYLLKHPPEPEILS